MDSRTVVSAFGRKHKLNHSGVGFFAGVKLFYHIFAQLLLNFPRILKLIVQYRFFKKKKSRARVALFSDNLDELNGIAVNSRLILQEMRRQGRDFHLFGIANHTRGAGAVEKSGTVLIPQVYSMEQVGYKDSEVAIPSLREVCILLRRYPLDLIEFETPSAGAGLILILCKLLGIRSISHFRTDIFYYVKLLTTNPLPFFVVKWWVRSLHHLAKPVIVPSTDFQHKIIDELWLKPKDVVKVDRGVALDSYGLHMAKNKWPGIHENKKVRFVFVGRISREKELVFLVEIWEKYKSNGGSGELTFVGSGPFLEDLKEMVGSTNDVYFAGRQVGEDLSSLYAEADFFLFPSGSDTFGNVVVEAMASGTPAIVSDSGGPKDIVADKAGFILPYKNKEKWVEQLLICEDLVMNKNDSYLDLQRNAIERSMVYTLEHSANQFWNLYENILKEEDISFAS